LPGMSQDLQTIILFLYALPMGLLCLYGLNVYHTLFLFLRKYPQETTAQSPLQEPPLCCTQIPVYNEYNVIERCLRAVARMDYPANRHHIQVLDDSTDQTRDLIDRIVTDLQQEGVWIEVVRRTHRTGYKAGALDEGMRQTDADLFAIFDADFVPPSDFLQRTIRELTAHTQAGFVQARWGHLNPKDSRLTWAQHIGIDGHFTIEQPARAWNGLYMNFNGTAGLWRRQAIVDAGGWEHDTLTEDMDLSYRCQFAGWTARFLFDLVVPAELPPDLTAFKSQQFRWAKGSIQTAKKLLPRLWKQPVGLHKKMHATLHLTHYAIHPLMCIMALLSLPFVILVREPFSPLVYGFIILGVILSCIAPTILYTVSQRVLYGRAHQNLRALPLLTLLGTGIALSNARAVFEALTGKVSGFVRTPKQGEKTTIAYKAKQPMLPLLELGLGIYCLTSVILIFTTRNHAIAPFLMLYAASFLYVGLKSLSPRWSFKLPRLRRRPTPLSGVAEPT